MSRHAPAESTPAGQDASPRVMVVSSKFPPEYSGSGLRAHRTYQRLARRYGVRYQVLCGSVSDHRDGRYSFEGTDVYRIGGRQGGAARSRRRGRITEAIDSRVAFAHEAGRSFAHLARNRGRFDVLHVFGRNNVTAGAVTFAKVFRRPLLLELVNSSEQGPVDPRQPEPWLIRRLLGDGLPPRTMLVAISERLRQDCEHHGYTRNVWCRPNPVDAVFRPGPRDAHRARLTPFSRDDIVLVHVGKFMPLKNQDFLVRVLAMLPPRFKLLLAGPLVDSGPNRDRDHAHYRRVLESVARVGLEHRVVVRPGFVDDVAGHLKAADLYVLPSTIEALATPVLEAVACGIPVVAHAIPGVTDVWIREGRNGYTSPLVADEFARRCQAAIEIPRATRLEEAERIHRLAGSDVIDEGYYRILMNLAQDDSPIAVPCDPAVR